MASDRLRWGLDTLLVFATLIDYVDPFSYAPILVTAGILASAATTVLFLLIGPIRQVDATSRAADRDHAAAGRGGRQCLGLIAEGQMVGTWVVALVLMQAAPEARSAPPSQPAVVRADEKTRLPASIDVRSELGKRFRFVEARVLMDGLELTRRTAPPGQELARDFRAFEGVVSPGPHLVRVSLVYQGRNTGPFTYLDDYRYVVESSAEFNAQAGSGPAAIDVRAYERPGATVPLEEKPAVEIRSAPGSGVIPVVTVATPALILD